MIAKTTPEERAAAARRAWACGRSAEPMGEKRRTEAYLRQTGRAELTPRQRRRANKKLMLELRQALIEGASA